MGFLKRFGLAASFILGLTLVTGCGDAGQEEGAGSTREAAIQSSQDEDLLVQSNEAEDDHHPAVEARDMQDITDDLHKTLLTIDTHVDIPDTFATDEVDPGKKGRFQVDLVKMKEGNLNAIFFIVYVGQKELTEENYVEAVKKARNKFDAIHRMTDELYSDQIELALTADDVERIHKAGKLVALIGVENGFAFGKDASTAEEYFDRGMRYAGFAHMGHSNFADSSWPQEHLGNEEEKHGGLSEKGRKLLSELNRLGVMADVSHASKAVTLEIANLSTAPVIASHSGVYSVYAHKRNLTDEELLAIKGTGGVVQIVAFDTYVKEPPAQKKAAVDALRKKYNYSRATRASLSRETLTKYFTELEEIHQQWPRASVSDMVDHLDYAVSLLGIDYVGISSDFDGGGGLTGWMNASETANVTEELIARGYSVGEIRKLWGGNMLRVMREVEAKAER